MSRRNENDSPVEATAPRAQEHQNPNASGHPDAYEQTVFDPADRNPPAPPTPRAPSASDAGFGSFG